VYPERKRPELKRPEMKLPDLKRPAQTLPATYNKDLLKRFEAGRSVMTA
jgi:hypothetical protein